MVPPPAGDPARTRSWRATARHWVVTQVNRRARGRWTILAVVGLVAGIFLAGKPLTELDQYASVGSFLASGLSVALALRSPTAELGADTMTRDREPISGRIELDVFNNAYVVKGERPVAWITTPIEPPQPQPGPTSAAVTVIRDSGAVLVGNDAQLIISDSG